VNDLKSQLARIPHRWTANVTAQ